MGPGYNKAISASAATAPSFINANPITRFVGRVLNSLGLLSCIQIRRRDDSYLVRRGWFESFQKNLNVDRDGNPIPWLPYPAIDFLIERVRTDMNVFEFGSGNSTLWWSKHAKSVVSVEHDRVWYERLKPLVPQNVELLFAELNNIDEYASSPTRTNQLYDVIIIDGRDRVRCAHFAVEALNKDGVIVWDNMERKDYQEGKEFLYEHGFRAIPYTGIGPAAFVSYTTLVFYRSNNCFGI